MHPMLDDRDQTGSSAQFDGVGVCDRASNVTVWSTLLGERRAGDDVSIYAAPARATDLFGLPPAFIDCGSAEVFVTRTSPARRACGAAASRPRCACGRADSTPST